ncbi:hypothetical protein M758_10G048100 [Ceratodon purpureus]|nr:hypothetical protein M758_10G048100 [Ceratodon purpureus]
MKRAAPTQHAAAAGCRPDGTAGCAWLVVILVLVSFGRCDAVQPLRSLQDVHDKENVTLPASNICLKSLVQEETLIWYNLDTSDCFEDPALGFQYLEVEARVFQHCSDDQEWFVVVNTQDEELSIDDAKSSKAPGTFVDLIGEGTDRLIGHLDIPLGNSSQPWVVGIYSSCGPVQFTMKSWCSVSKGCNLSCGDPDSGPCVSVEKCRCTRTESDSTCTVDVEILPDEEDDVSRHGFTHNGDTLKFGAWKYFRFEAFDNASRTLVELERAYGDLILYVKPEDDDDGDDGDFSTDSVPTEQDIKYADLLSFQNRLSHHSVFVNGSGNYYIGIYNADTCLQEDSMFNLTVTTATPQDPMNLCPLNCSYPQGQCVSDNVCSCEPGYGGQYCAGSLSPASAVNKYSGKLAPGGWAYINMSIDQMSEDIDVSISFRSDSGHPILLAQQNRFPTLKDYHLKFSNSTLGATPSDVYRINGNSLILGVFNVDYMDRGVSNFEISVIGVRKELAIWIIILVALGSSVVLLSGILTIRLMIQKRGQTDPAAGGMDFEATPQDLEMVQNRSQATVMISSLPLVAYQKGMVPKEDAGCSICLNNYDIGEIVCRLPRCGHIFHIRCLEEWFRTDGSCPLCRVALQDPGGEPSQQSPGYLLSTSGERLLAGQAPSSS